MSQLSIIAATAEQTIINTQMSRVRESVKWSNKDLKQLWTRNDYSRRLMVSKGPISILYVCTALLLNFKTCFENGGQVGAYF